MSRVRFRCGGGKFAPVGAELLLSLDGVKALNPHQDVYSKKEVYPLVFNHLQAKADAALDSPMGPDFGEVKRYLYQAASFAPTKQLREKNQLRLKSIDFVVLFLKADFALSKGTLPDLKAATAYLDKAEDYATTSYQRDLLSKTRAVVKRAMAGLKRG